MDCLLPAIDLLDLPHHSTLSPNRRQPFGMVIALWSVTTAYGPAAPH